MWQTAASSEPSINPHLLKGKWEARWITHPDGPFRDYGVFHFRRTFSLERRPGSFVIHVTADNRYQLYVNGVRVAQGPARGDLLHWRFDTIDIGPYLKEGENTLAAVVWNFSPVAAFYQITNQTGFLVQGNSPAEETVNTDARWRTLRNDAYEAYRELEGSHLSVSVVGPGERLSGPAYPWGWEQPEYDDSGWKAALPIPYAYGVPRGMQGDPFSEWFLIPRPIPFMEEKAERFQRIARSEGQALPSSFVSGDTPVTIPPNSHSVILFDQGYLTTAFPELTVCGGAGSTIKLTYAEGLWIPGTREKGNRDDIEGKEIRGYSDLFMPDGGANRTYRTLHWRTFRYLELRIDTKDTPLTLNSFTNTFCGYPYTRKAEFESSDPELTSIWEMGWRTLRLCTSETFFDCPYYEQLQYVGDTRVEALVMLAMSGDHRLMRNALQIFDESRTAEGLTQSRYPCRVTQYIPTYSLAWINMLRDYWWYVDDEAYVRELVPHTRTILEWFGRHVLPEQLLGDLPFWNFIDWAENFPHGVPPEDMMGRSSILSLSYVSALLDAAILEESFGDIHIAAGYRAQAARIKEAIRRTCWDSRRGLFADTPELKGFSQHANVLAVLLDVVPDYLQRDIMKKILADSSITRCTFYYQYYLHAALSKAGMGADYIRLLEPWREMVSLGLSTCPETPEPTRSDCHAWSASPNYNLLAITCGIRPSQPGFRSVHIAPEPGPLTHIRASMPHREGWITLSLTRTGDDGLMAEIILPGDLTGTFAWRDSTVQLESGRTALEF